MGDRRTKGQLILAVGLVVLMVTRFSVTRPVEDLVQSFREVGSREPVSRVPVRRAALEQARYLVEVGRTVNLSGCTEYRRAGEERLWTL